MKNKLLLLCSIFLLNSLQYLIAQTQLNPGDIAIVQINKSYESFDFVPLVPITTGTKIVFSDMKYSASQHGFVTFLNSQYTGIHTFTATRDYAAGTVIQSKNNLDESNKILFNAGSGLSLIAFQVNNNDTTFITAFGWLAAQSFKAGVNDIPPGLSIANNTVVKFDSTETYFNKYMYYSIKFDNMGDVSKMEGTAIQLRRRFADASNFLHSNSTIPNTPVANFNVLAPDLINPTLVSINPTKNKINVSPIGGVELKFSEPVIAKKTITIRNTSSGATQYIIPSDVIVDGSDLSFSYGTNLDYATSYTLEFPQGAFTDLDNNPWPAIGDSVIAFATSAKRSVIDIDFRNKAKDDLVWTTTNKDVTEWDTRLKGYWSFSVNGVPMRYYKSEVVQSENSAPSFNGSGEIWITNPMVNSRLVVDLTGINNTVTALRSNLYANNAPLTTQFYSQGNVLASATIKTTTNSLLRYIFGENNLGYVRLSLLNENASKIDSIVYKGMEAVVFATKIELIDLDIPVVELGANRTICEGDSVILDAGCTPGAVYSWNTNETTQKICVKTTDTYSVTVKNTLGQRSDNVLVTVRPSISVSLPDTIKACVGDTVTLTAGTDVSNSYFWSPSGQTTPSIKVTRSGIYHVLVNNGYGGCFTSDSTRVIFSGAKIHAYHYQGGVYGTGDVVAELYMKNIEGKYLVYREKEMLQSVQFDSLPKGDYILKAHFKNYSFVGENPFLDTYQDGKIEWSKVIPFKLTCVTDTMIGFLLANKPVFEFNGSGVISGKIQIIGKQSSPARKVKSITSHDCSTRLKLYNVSGVLIATTCPDIDGNYSFSNLPDGDYSVGVERTGFDQQTVFTANVVAGSTVGNANFTVNESTQSIQQGISSGFISTKDNGIMNMKAYPNPARLNTTLEYYMMKDERVQISTTDLTGRILKLTSILSQAGRNTVKIDLPALSGMYFVKIHTSIGDSVVRVVVE